MKPEIREKVWVYGYSTLGMKNSSPDSYGRMADGYFGLAHELQRQRWDQCYNATRDRSEAKNGLDMMNMHAWPAARQRCKVHMGDKKTCNVLTIRIRQTASTIVSRVVRIAATCRRRRATKGSRLSEAPNTYYGFSRWVATAIEAVQGARPGVGVGAAGGANC
jgi:hypothetical protein